MNTPDPRQGTDAASPRLPDLSADRIDEIEAALFAGIAKERSSRRRSARGRVWLGVGAAAAVVVVATVISPMVVGGLGRSASGSPVSLQDDSGRELAPQSASDAGGVAVAPQSIAADSAAGGAVPDTTREVVERATAGIRVDDIAAAVRQIGQAAVALGGYVESSTVGQSDVVAPLEGIDGKSIGIVPMPSSLDGGSVTVRVPADQLAPLVDQLADVGEVTASSTDRQDVTDQAIDLRARIDAAQASVTRLTQLMSQAASVADLITAESALADRQATLESYQQQLASLEQQVDLSSLSVSLTRTTAPVQADPAGFGDGLAAGWNGLVATFNGIVVGLGFLLPWLVVAAVIVLLGWWIVRRIRRPREPTPTPE